MTQVRLDMIRDSSDPIRKTWDEDKMVELAQSIHEQGVIVPIKVRPAGDGYEIVYGHRRIEAARRANLTEIPAVIEGVDDETALIQALVENVQREDMTAIETARALQRIKDETGESNIEIGATFGKAERWVRDHLVMLRPEIAKVAESAPAPITAEHVKEARRGHMPDEQAATVLRKAVSEDLSKRDIRKVADAMNAAEDDAEREAIIDTPYRDPAFEQMVRAKAGVARRAVKQERREREANPREVKEFLDAIKMFTDVVDKAKSVAKFGKFSPEAKRFTVGWIDGLIEELSQLRQTLQGGE